jgi:hypothetical protein
MAHDSTIGSAHTQIAAAALLDRWAAHDWSDGLRITDLLPLDRVVVRTLNSTYEMVVTTAGASDIMVRGGAFFASLTRARLAGSSLGGSFLKLHVIHVGFRMEIVTDEYPIITSPVQTIAVTRATGIM